MQRLSDLPRALQVAPGKSTREVSRVPALSLDSGSPWGSSLHQLDLNFYFPQFCALISRKMKTCFLLFPFIQPWKAGLIPTLISSFQGQYMLHSPFHLFCCFGHKNYVVTHSSQTFWWIRSPWKAYENTSCRAPLPESLNQQVWGGAQECAFLTSLQVLTVGETTGLRQAHLLLIRPTVKMGGSNIVCFF